MLSVSARVPLEFEFEFQNRMYLHAELCFSSVDMVLWTYIFMVGVIRYGNVEDEA